MIRRETWLTIVLVSTAADDNKVSEAILSGLWKAYACYLVPTPRHPAKCLTISCATIPPILMPITWRSLLFVHPRWLHTSRVSFANSDVEYRMIGLSLSPIPLLSKIRQEYFSGCAWPKSFNWRCQYHLKPPNPVIHYQTRDMSHDPTCGVSHSTPLPWDKNGGPTTRCLGPLPWIS